MLQKKLLFLAFLLLNIQLLTAQSTPRFGLYYVQNFSAHIEENPERPQDGRSETGTLGSGGIGAFYELPLTRSLSVQSQLKLHNKGYHSIYQDDAGQHFARNPFRYVTAETNVLYWLGEYKEWNLNAGLNYNYLYQFREEGHLAQHVGFTQADFLRKSVGFNVGFGILLDDVLYLEARLQRDITPLVDQPTARLRIRTLSVQLGMNLAHFYKKNKATLHE